MPFGKQDREWKVQCDAPLLQMFSNGVSSAVKVVLKGCMIDENEGNIRGALSLTKE